MIDQPFVETCQVCFGIKKRHSPLGECLLVKWFISSSFTQGFLMNLFEFFKRLISNTIEVFSLSNIDNKE